MKIRKFNAIIALISASLALSSCIFTEKGETPKTPTESTLLAVDNRANSYVVGEIFDNYVTNGGLTPKVRMSDNTEKALTKNDFTYEIKTATESTITGKQPFTTSGNYTVTVSRLQLKPVSYTIRVNPKEEPTPVATLTSISVTGYSDEVYQGDEYVFSGTVIATYSDKTTKDVTSDAIIGTISTDTLGEKQLKVSYKEGDVTRQLSLTIKVVEKPAVDVKITSITFSQTSKSLVVGNNYTVTTTITPSNATNKSLTWSSSNSDVAIVSNGIITAKAVGNARITATAKDGSNKSAYINIEVTPVLVTRVTLSPTSKTVEIGDTFNLSASITPSNATNKEVEWTTSNSSVATVSGGAVTAVGTGIATITATAKDGSGCKGTCSVTVNSKPVKVTSITLNETSINLTKGSTKSLTATVTPTNATEKGVTWSSNSSTVASVSISGLVTAKKTGTATITATAKDGSGVKATCTVKVTTPVTGISLNKTTLSLNKGASETLTATIAPSDADNKNVTWSGTTDKISVDQTGKVTVSSTATLGQTATIVATSNENPSFKASCVVTVADTPARDAWTLLVYMCGADLESDYADSYDDYGERMYGCATEDLMEIASVNNQPSDVNVVVQAGGAKKWDSYYSSVINKDKCNRFHLSNKNYVKDSQTTKVDMSQEESLESFVEWGLKTYPAEKVGLVLWNHGGAMDGCCFDEQFNSGKEGLTPSEVASAIPTAISKSGYNQNLEFIGYDCCLMSIQDIAGLNADYANYMIASEESEWGYGWSYDKWIDDLFAKKTTANILKACVDGFAQDTEEAYSQWGESNDQTLAYYSLQNWSNYENAWENFSSYLSSNVIKSSTNWNTFKNVVNSAKKYGRYTNTQLQSYNNGYICDIFDVKDFLNKFKTNSNYKSNTTLMNKVSSVETAFAGLDVYSKCGDGAGNSYGLCLFCPISGYNEKDIQYAEDNTCFSAWRQLCIEYGNWYY